MVCPRPVPDAALRIFLLHHAGGSHLAYRDWPALFPADWEVCLLEAPGRGRLADLPVLPTAEQVVTFFLEDLRPWLDRPFAVFGHSMGALLGYELTLRLMAEGLPLPVWLGLSARGAPRADGHQDVVQRHLLSDDELRRVVGAMGGTPPEVLADPGWWAMLEPLLRNDFRLAETWRPAPGTPKLPVPVTVFGGEQDIVVRPERLAEWAGHTERYLGLRLSPGDHFYFRHDTWQVVDRIVADVAKVR
ncbi:Thioesterase (plasmid) [Streptantibioticus cattleyicolor NRRL 8057 = DSM 46488]|nr:Thioesterase [Streptantibioticus cattleyicolor NRRL 8057 = DSM 46488]